MRLYPQQLFFHGAGSKPEYVFTVDFWHRPAPAKSNEAKPGEISSDDDSEDEVICATGGADTVVRLWKVVKGSPAQASPANTNTQASPDGSSSSSPVEKDGIDTPMAVMARDPHLVMHKELIGSHSHGCVTCVRFAPPVAGEPPVLASAGDDGQVVFWVYSESPLTGEMQWTAQPRALNCLDEVSGIAWSPSGRQLAVCLHRELCVVWDVATAKQIQRLDGHTSRVLGVAWDPRDRYICTTSADRTCRVWARNKRKSFYPKAVIRTYDAKVMAEENEALTDEALGPGAEDSVPASIAERTVREKIFINDSHYAHDATAHFFRRPSFSPDGRLLLVPGCLTPHGDYGCLVLARGDGFSNPAAIINSGSVSPTVCSRFFPSPIGSPGHPSHYVFTVGTAAAQLVLYDTSVFTKGGRRLPRAAGSDLHCTSIVDLAFDGTGKFLAVAGSDGYVTLCSLDDTDLGGSPCVPEVAEEKALGTTPLEAPLINTDRATECTTAEPIPSAAAKRRPRALEAISTGDHPAIPAQKVQSPVIQTVFAAAADFVRAEAPNFVGPPSRGPEDNFTSSICSPAKRPLTSTPTEPPAPKASGVTKKCRRKITPTLVKTPARVVDARPEAEEKSPVLELVRIDLEPSTKEALQQLRDSLPKVPGIGPEGGGLQ
ncbi:Chromatin assembly factor 1 subunit B [Perkinsus olseni]|uniref:Chromatin assembly factor 1 subunit B n=1 Tax=Perkinsus olseni TaxID=32597 RepID=A0A7J6NZM6_PEROL|nr:Chromatin assembly factor 1 subunit B [Perkinsus olseni]